MTTQPSTPQPASTRLTLMLRPHPAGAAMHRWDREDPEWMAFLEDIRVHGIKTPLRITHDNLVIDGETRRQAARCLNLDEVPVVEIGEDEVSDTILRELCLRRNLTQGQLAYTAYPFIAHEIAAARGADGDTWRQNFCKSLETSGPHSVQARGQKGDVRSIACRFGLSVRVLQQAAEIHELLEQEQNEDLRRKYELAIFDPEKPAGLGGVLAGIKSEIDQAKWEAKGLPHGGGRPAEQARQLQLFSQVWRDLENRWEYWQRWDEPTRAKAIQPFKEQAQEMPDDLLVTMEKALAAEIRRRHRAHYTVPTEGGE